MSKPKPLPLHELEYRLLYAMVVAGKSATFATNAMKRFLGVAGSPFALVRLHAGAGTLGQLLRIARTGNYTKLERGFAEAATCGIDLTTASAPALEKIHGIGPKTSRFFILWTRDGDHAAIDTHVLKWLGMQGRTSIRATPSGPLYSQLEKIFLAEAKARKMTPRQLDAKIWDHCTATRLEWSRAYDPGAWPQELR